MKYFDTVDTKEALDNYSYSTRQSTIVRAKDTNDVKINGVNMTVDIPAPGDLLCITKYMDGDTLKGPDEQKIVWMKGSTINAATFPADIYEAVGVVYKVQGRHAWVIYKDTPKNRFADVYSYKQNGGGVTGDVTFTCTVNKISTTVTATLTGTLYSDISILNKALSDKGLDKYFLFNTINQNVYELICQHNCTISGLTIGMSTREDTTVNIIGGTSSNDCFLCGDKGERKTWFIAGNYDSFYNYVKSNTNLKYVEENIPVNKATFETDDKCADMRTTYETYEKYIMSFLPTWPCNSSNLSDYSNGYKTTYMLASKTSPVASDNYTYPAAAYASQLCANQTNLVAGKWYIPSAIELYELYNNIDVIGNDFLQYDTTEECWTVTGSAGDGTISGYYNVAVGNVGGRAIGSTYLPYVYTVSPKIFQIVDSPNYNDSRQTVCITDFDF